MGVFTSISHTSELVLLLLLMVIKRLSLERHTSTNTLGEKKRQREREMGKTYQYTSLWHTHDTCEDTTPSLFIL